MEKNKNKEKMITSNILEFCYYYQSFQKNKWKCFNLIFYPNLS